METRSIVVQKRTGRSITFFWLGTDCDPHTQIQNEEAKDNVHLCRSKTSSKINTSKCRS